MATYNLTSSIPAASSLAAGDILNCPYSGVKKEITLPKGKYKLEVWGALGGYRSSASYGGKGGYSYGTITLNQPTTVYLYAGGFPGNTTSSAGSSTTRAGGFNGGGSRYGYYGGGGGSDIRIGQDNLYARVIVAGGGGSDGATNKTGMYGGGTSGGSASQSFGTGGGGGTQTAGGTGGSGNAGSFGQGGQGKYYSNGYAGAGGGGWYGGGGSYPDGSGDDDRGGGGGSGYILTSSSSKPSGYLLGSEYYLTDAAMVAGNASFTDYSGSTVTGHSGHGACRITAIEVIQDSSENKNLYLKTDAKSSLPSSYVELPYIESTGTQYIDTGFKPTYLSKIIMNVSDYLSDKIGFFFGTRDTSSSTSPNLFNCYRSTTTALRSDYFGTNVSYSINNVSQKTTIIKDKNILSCFDNCIIQNTAVSSGTCTYPLVLFALNSAGTVGHFGYFRLYSCKIYDNETLIRNYIPALRVSDSKAGLYDTVNSTFYLDAAGGNFIYNRNNYMDSNTILYLQGDTLTDSSPNSLTFTNNGVTVIDFERNDSHKKALYFNGSSSYMTTSFSHTGDITFEAWIYLTSTTNTNYPTPYAVRAGSYRGMYFHANTSVTFCGVNSSGGQITGTGVTPVPANKWVHYAQVRQGTTIYNFIDGKLKSTIANSGTTTSGLTLGTLSESDSNLVNASCYFLGYMTDIKISKGAKWISDFTPYELIHGTNYARIQESYIKTSSTTHTSQYSGYTLLPYIESTGTQYIDTGFKPNNNTRIIMDAQMMPGYTSVTYPIYFGCRDSTNALYHELYKAGGTTSYLYFFYGPTYTAYYLNPDYTERKMIDMNKNVCTMNGEVLKYSTTNTYQMSYNLFLGADNQNGSVVTNSITPLKIYSCKIYNNGTLIRDYIPAMRNSDLKIGLYDKLNKVFYPDAAGGNFISNTLDIDTSTKLLLKGTTADASGKSSLGINGVTTANVKHLNDSCLYFPGASEFISATNIITGTNDFTIDWWEYPLSANNNEAVAWSPNASSGNAYGFLTGYYYNNNVYSYASSNGSSWDIFGSVQMGTAKLKQWTHRACVRNGSKFYFFENGKLINTATSSGSIASSTNINIGYYSSTSNAFYGYLDNVRISNTARWTSDFTPPALTYGADWRKIKEIYVKRNPSTAEPKMSQYDTNIYTESDGSKWIRIFHHNNPASYLFASTDDFTKDVYKDTNRWASLYLLKDLDVKEIMLKQCLTSGAAVSSFRWHQPKNPIDSTWNDDAQGSCTFHPSYTAPSTNYGGLHLHKSNTYIACHNATQSNWFGAIGSWTAHNSGSPGYNGTTITTGYMDLYIPYKEPEAWVKI